MSQVVCPSCGLSQPVAEEKIGREVYCEECGKKFTAEGLAQEAAAAAAPEYVWEGSPLWRYYFWQTFFGVLLIPAFGIGLLLLLGVWIRRITYKYQVTGSHIIARIGIFSVNTIQIAVKDIRSIEIRASFFHRLLGVREILISTAGNAGVELTMHGIPDEVADTIQKLQRK